MEKKMSLARIMDLFTNIMAIIGGVMICGLTLLVSVSVVMRYFLNMPVMWTVIVSEYLLYTIAFVTAPWVMKQGEHVSVEILEEYLPTKASKRILHIISGVLGIIACSITAYFACITTYTDMVRGTKMLQAIAMPRYCLLAVMSVSMILMVYYFFVYTIKSVHERTQPRS